MMKEENKSKIKKIVLLIFGVLFVLGLFSTGALKYVAICEFIGAVSYGLVFGTGLLKIDRVPANTQRIYQKLFGGKLTKKEGGLRLVFGFAKQVQDVSTLMDTYDVPKISANTSDVMNVLFDFSVKYQITDALKFNKSADNALTIIEQDISTPLQDYVRGLTFDQINTDNAKQTIADNVFANINSELTNFGINLVKIKLKKVDYPDSIVKAREQKLKAKQEAEAKKIEVEAAIEVQKKKNEAEMEIAREQNKNQTNMLVEKATLLKMQNPNLSDREALIIALKSSSDVNLLDLVATNAIIDRSSNMVTTESINKPKTKTLRKVKITKK